MTVPVFAQICISINENSLNITFLIIVEAIDQDQCTNPINLVKYQTGVFSISSTNGETKTHRDLGFEKVQSYK